ncbi:MAG: ferrous iron transporter B [Deltaproteobacteria bacterium]|nr:MAG: ferrous iron transporter B [Deltaproteobacteria bacterium]
MGNPNVGKSVVFSRLTGVNVIASNYPGTTVEYTQGFLKVGDDITEVIDVPGTYSLEPACQAEEVALKMLKEVEPSGKNDTSEAGDLIINVVDATNLERNLHLTLDLLERNLPMVVALNMWDETKHRGIEIDVVKLEEYLGVPVIPTVALTGQGIKELVSKLPEASSPTIPVRNHDLKWTDIGRMTVDVQNITHRHHTIRDRVEEWSMKPWSGLLFAAVIIFLSFELIRFIGEGLIGYLFEPLFEDIYLPILMKLSGLLGSSGFLHDILIGKLIDGKIDFVQSFGLLSTGLFVPLGMVLPYIFSFYLILGFLEDWGYLPRLAVLVDTIMHRLGLHGYAILPMILGLGCNVPGAMATRVLESRRERFIAATLMSIAVPCMAQIAVIIGLVGQRGGIYVAQVFLTLFLLWIVLGLVLRRVIKGISPELLVEIPPYHIPYWSALLKKLWIRLSGFLREAIPLVLIGVLLVNILYTLKIIDFLARLAGPFLTTLWGVPDSVISALLIGFLRKDVAVGMLEPLGLTTKQLVISCTVLTVYFPCIATFAVLIRELGVKDMFKSALLMILTAIIVGFLLNMIL